MEITQEHITLGRLMSPTDTLLATEGRTDIPAKLRDRWFACADVPYAFVERFIVAPEDTAFRITVLASARTNYLALCVRAGTTEIRFVMPLGAPVANDFLAQVSVTGLMLSLAPAESNTALLVPFASPPSSFLPVLEASCQTSPLPGQEAIDDFGDAVGQLLMPETLPLVPTFGQAEQVHVVLLTSRTVVHH